MRSARLVIVVASLLALAAPAYPFGSFGGTIDSRTNIFGAGHAVAPDPGGGGGGLLPAGLDVSSTPAGVIQFASVTGACAGYDGGSYIGPDGGTGDDTAVTSYGGIAGINVEGHQLFLAGVFLSGTPPVDPPPATLSYAEADTRKADYYPLPNQVFFIGDGLTGTGSGTAQRFHIPASANLLYLGFVDGWAFAGAPGWYDDNTGSLQVLATITGSLATISSLTLDPDSVQEGSKIKGKLQLRAAAPAGGVSIPITSSNLAVVEAATCQVKAGSRQGKFTLKTHTVTKRTRVQITATSTNSVTKRVKVNPD